MAKKRLKKRKRKARTKSRKPRNFLAILAWFRKSGAMRNKKKERLKKLCKEKPSHE